MLLLVAPALAYPKAFLDTVEVLAVAPDGHHVLLGTLTSFDDTPHTLRERDARTGVVHPIANEDSVAKALATCSFDEPCPALDAAWIPGAWVNWNQDRYVANWTVTEHGSEGWTTMLGDECTETAMLYVPCMPLREGTNLDVRARLGEVVVTLEAADYHVHGRSARIGAKSLAKMGATGTPTGVAVWGTDGVLVVFPGAEGPEDQAADPPMVFVLPTR